MQRKRALFIFRRDLRLEDNIGLLTALENYAEVIPAFIFTPGQLQSNPYRGDPCIQFMVESLQDLDEELREKGSRLFCFFDQPDRVIRQCKELGLIHGVIVNRDYTPYSRQRDQRMQQTCQDLGIEFLMCEDTLLHQPESTCKKDGTPYIRFTPFFQHAQTRIVPLPRSNSYRSYFRGNIPFALSTWPPQPVQPTPYPATRGGRTEALSILNNIERYAHYDRDRDIPSLDGTTLLSAHLKFTTCSPRECYHQIYNLFGSDHGLIRSLFWRDFFTSIGWYFPHVFAHCFHKELDALPWDENVQYFQAWCEGRTGFPIVDAGMRQLNQTGWMHNRVRMITASFLTKDLHIPWQWGERYFAQKLIDYDPAVNNGNWQWVASTGCDAQPYFRIFNPWLQQKRWDPSARYITKWVPELAGLHARNIHIWSGSSELDYPAPLVNHEKEAARTKESFLSLQYAHRLARTHEE